MDRIAVVLVTHNRLKYSIPTVDFVCKNLHFNGEIGWYVGDDSGEIDGVKEIIKVIEKNKLPIIGYHCEDFTPGNHFCGTSWNFAQSKGWEWADIILWLEDDWELKKPLDITPYFKILVENKGVGMIRLGHLPVGSDLHSVGYDGIHYLRYEKTTSYAYSGNPALKHKRFYNAYGDFPMSAHPGNIEVAFDIHVRQTSGPEIWWPVDLGGYGVFSHIGGSQSYQ